MSHAPKGAITFTASIVRRRSASGKSISSGHKATVVKAVEECLAGIGRCRLKEGDYVSVTDWTASGDGFCSTSLSLLMDKSKRFTLMEAQALVVAERAKKINSEVAALATAGELVCV